MRRTRTNAAPAGQQAQRGGDERQHHEPLRWSATLRRHTSIPRPDEKYRTTKYLDRHEPGGADRAGGPIGASPGTTREHRWWSWGESNSTTRVSVTPGSMRAVEGMVEQDQSVVQTPCTASKRAKSEATAASKKTTWFRWARSSASREGARRLVGVGVYVRPPIAGKRQDDPERIAMLAGHWRPPGRPARRASSLRSNAGKAHVCVNRPTTRCNPVREASSHEIATAISTCQGVHACGRTASLEQHHAMHV